MSYVLQWIYDGDVGSLAFNDNANVHIGRSEDCEVSLIDDRMSRKHAKLDLSTLMITNLSTSNPVFIHRFGELEHHHIELNTNDTHVLEVGEVFIIGKTQVRVLEQADDGVKVRCWSCHQHVDAVLADCPWCGVTLAFGTEI